MRIAYRTLRFTTSGRLLPWLGPACRGLTAGMLKARTCRHSPLEQRTRWIRCTGCPHLLDCAVGLTFEFDPPGGRAVTKDLRPIVLGPEFPAPQHVEAGQEVGVRIVLIGPQACGTLEAVVEAMAQAGARQGLGPDGVRFACHAEATPRTPEGGWHPLEVGRLPRRVDGDGACVPRLAIRLDAPLFLSGHGGDPLGFADLFRASLRVVGRVAAAFGEPLEGRVDLANLKRAAAGVRTVASRWRPFHQARWSNRSQEGYALRGVYGEAVFSEVPVALIPWVAWGGRFGVGRHRVAGAGTWHVVCG